MITFLLILDIVHTFTKCSRKAKYSRAFFHAIFDYISTMKILHRDITNLSHHSHCASLHNVQQYDRK